MSAQVRYGSCIEEWLNALSLLQCMQHNGSNYLVLLILQTREIHIIHFKINIIIMHIGWAYLVF